jgi:hypothetical protein
MTTPHSIKKSPNSPAEPSPGLSRADPAPIPVFSHRGFNVDVVYAPDFFSMALQLHFGTTVRMAVDLAKVFCCCRV